MMTKEELVEAQEKDYPWVCRAATWGSGNSDYYNPAADPSQEYDTWQQAIACLALITIMTRTMITIIAEVVTMTKKIVV